MRSEALCESGAGSWEDSVSTDRRLMDRRNHFPSSTAQKTMLPKTRLSARSAALKGTVLKTLCNRGTYTTANCNKRVSATAAMRGLFDSRPILKVDSCHERIASTKWGKFSGDGRGSHPYHLFRNHFAGARVPSLIPEALAASRKRFCKRPWSCRQPGEQLADRTGQQAPM
jgi:hypothetical protein